MTAQPIPIEKDPPEPDITAPDHRERLIESLADLLSAGRPFSDVLEDAKRLAGCLSEPTSNIGPEEKGTVAELREPCFDIVTPEHDPKITADAQPPLNPSVTSKEKSAIQIGRFTGRLAFWSVPTALLMLIAFTGITVFANLPADAVSIVTTSTAEPAVTPAKLSPATPSPQPNLSPTESRPKLSSEQTKMLVDRGDELMKRADVIAGRLFYERAADAGVPEAALRLGASYDPAFLTRAGIKGVQGDPALAARWYKRARDLGATVEAEVLLKGLNSR